MAKITFKLIEVKSILDSFGLIPPILTDIDVGDDEVCFRINQGAIKKFLISSKYIDFNNGIVKMKVKPKGFFIQAILNIFKGVFTDYLTKKLEKYSKFIEIDYPKVCIDVNVLLQEILKKYDIKELKIENISYNNGYFEILLSI